MASSPDQASQSSEINYAKVLKLFLHKDTAHLHSRQIAQLRRIARHSNTGFSLRSLPTIQQLLTLSLERLDAGHKEFLAPLTALVAVSGLPSRCTVSNEELTPTGLVASSSLYTALTNILRTAEDDSVRVAAADALTNIGKGRSIIGRSVGVANVKVLGVAGGVVKNDQRPSARDLNQGMLAKSGVVEGAVDVLRVVVNNMVEKLGEEGGKSKGGYESDASTDDEEKDNEFTSDLATPGTADLSLPTTDDLADALPPPVADPSQGLADTMEAPNPDAPAPDALTTVSGLPPPPPSSRGLLMSLLRLLVELSASPSNSLLLIRAAVSPVLATTISRLNDDRDSTLNMCVDILWNCLEHAKTTIAEQPPASSRTKLVYKFRQANAQYCLGPAIPALCTTFTDLLQRGFRNKDKETRNEVLILSSLIASNVCSHEYFLNSGYAKVMCVYATVAEVGRDPDGDGVDNVAHVDPHNFATVSPADIELKRILWGLLSDLARKDKDILKVIVDSPLIETLLMYLDTDLDGDGIEDTPEYIDPEVADEDKVDDDGDGVDDALQEAAEIGGAGANNIISRIPRTQLRVLQQQVMAVLLNLAPRAPDKFRALGGHMITLKFLDWCGDSAGNRDLVSGALMLLISVVGLPGLQEELAQLNAIRIMLGRFNDTNAPESLRADSVRIISRLCKNNKDNQEMFRRDLGIAPLIRELEEYTKHRRVICGKVKLNAMGTGLAKESKTKESSDDDESEGSLMGGSAKEKVSPLIAGVVDCIWNAVAGNNRCEARLLEVEGQDALLDLLEVCPVLMRNQICGVLADLSMNKRCIPYLTAWRSDRSMVSAIQLMMRVWEEEEVRKKVARADGVINNLWLPLGKHFVGAERPSRPVDYFNDFGKTGDDADADGVDDGLQTNEESGEVGVGTLAAFKKLEKALAAGQKAGGNLEGALKKMLKGEDVRGKIAGVIESVGWVESEQGLSAHEKMTLVVVKNWLVFTKASAWMSVRDLCVADGVKPIMADALLVGSHLEEAYNVGLAAADAQDVLWKEKQQDIVNEEGGFFGSILMQRDQQIHQLQIKKKASMPKSLNKRKAEKEAKAAMLAKSLVKEGDSGEKGPAVVAKVMDAGGAGEQALGADSSVEEYTEEKKE